MSLTAKDIAEIARLLDESHFSSLDLTVGDFRLKIRREGSWSGDDEDEEMPVRAPKADKTPSEPPPPIGQEAGAARVGEIDVLMVSDGVQSLPGTMLAHNADPSVRVAWLNDMFLPPDMIEWPLNVVVGSRDGLAEVPPGAANLGGD